MSSGAKAIIDALDDLPPAEREEVVAELLRRVGASDHASPADEELTAAADQVFLALDRAEHSTR